MPVRQQGRQPSYRHGLHHGSCSARVIGVVVSEYQSVQPGDAHRPQRWDQDTVAAIGAIAEIRPGIVEQRMMPGLRGNRQALSHIENYQAQGILCGRLRRIEEHRQQQKIPASVPESRSAKVSTARPTCRQQWTMAAVGAVSTPLEARC